MSFGSTLSSVGSSVNSAVTSSGGNSMEMNIVAALNPWWDTLMFLSYFIGLVFAIFGLLDIVKEGREGGGIKKGAISFFSGAFLLSLPALMDASAQTIFGTNAPSSLSYASTASNGYAAAVDLAVTVVMLVGVFGYIKSFMLFRESAKDGSKFGIGVWHLIGATIAVNIVTFLNAVGVTVGGQMQTMITNFIN